MARRLFIVAYWNVSSACLGRSFANKVLGRASAGPGTKKYCAVVAAVTSFGSHVTPASDYLYSAYFPTMTLWYYGNKTEDLN